MTGLEKILKEINHSAKTEAEKIIASAKAEADKMQEDNNKKIAEKTQEISSRSSLNVKSMIERGESNEQLKKRNSLLETKQQAINSTIEEAKKYIVSLPDDQYFKLLAGWAKDVDGSGDADLKLNKKDSSRQLGDFLTSFNKDLTVKLSPQAADIEGGFLLVNGDIITNCSLEAMFDNYHDQILDKTQKILFGSLGAL